MPAKYSFTGMNIISSNYFLSAYSVTIKFCNSSHDKALEAMTMKGEAENKTRFHAVITALKGDNYPATLKVYKLSW